MCQQQKEKKMEVDRRRIKSTDKLLDKDEKKVSRVKERLRIRKAHRERKREIEIGPKPGLPKYYSNEGTQNKNCSLLRCKRAKCYNAIMSAINIKQKDA